MAQTFEYPPALNSHRLHIDRTDRVAASMRFTHHFFLTRLKLIFLDTMFRKEGRGNLLPGLTQETVFHFFNLKLLGLMKECIAKCAPQSRVLYGFGLRSPDAVLSTRIDQSAVPEFGQGCDCRRGLRSFQGHYQYGDF